tara:strand:+ start:36 stop:254 length:219 start_codon:yes stop_codon:yes gene_type:complete
MKRLFASLCLIVLIGFTTVYKNFKGKQLCLSLKNDQLNLEKVKKLEEYSGLEGTAVFDYCAKIGVFDMATES